MRRAPQTKIIEPTFESDLERDQWFYDQWCHSISNTKGLDSDQRFRAMQVGAKLFLTHKITKEQAKLELRDIVAHPYRSTWFDRGMTISGFGWVVMLLVMVVMLIIYTIF